MRNPDFYFERQYNWSVLVIIALVFSMVLIVGGIQEDMSDRDFLYAITVVGAIFLFILLMTFRMDVTADKYGISVVVGIGIIRRHITYDTIASVSPVNLKGRNLMAIGVPPFTFLSFPSLGKSWKIRQKTMMYNMGFCSRGIAIHQPGFRKEYHLIGSRRRDELLSFVSSHITPKSPPAEE